jgi:SAM-dependent methyltransferase
MLPGTVVIGSDFHDEPPADLAGVPYIPMCDLGDEEGRFDMVLAMHVLEHDDDAAGLLDRITAMVRPGGTVVLEVPNIDCVWTSLFGGHWAAWYLPFHRTHFSPTSLKALVVSRGLKVVACGTDLFANHGPDFRQSDRCREQRRVPASRDRTTPVAMGGREAKWPPLSVADRRATSLIRISAPVPWDPQMQCQSVADR